MNAIWKGFAGVAFLLAASGALPTAAAQPAGKPGMVMQVSDNDPARWNLALNNAQNAQAELGRDGVDIEIVAYGPGIGMLKMDSVAGTRVAEALKNGVRIVACENTMQHQKLTKADMLSGIGYARAGVVELMQRQREGYAYIRP